MLHHVDQRLGSTVTEILGAVDARLAESHRHMGVLVEGLHCSVQLLAERVDALAQETAAIRREFGEEFRQIDRRFLRLETRLSALERS